MEGLHSVISFLPLLSMLTVFWNMPHMKAKHLFLMEGDRPSFPFPCAFKMEKVQGSKQELTLGPGSPCFPGSPCCPLSPCT